MLFALAGCGTQAQIEAIKITSTAGDVYRKVLACSAEIEAVPQYARIYEKLGVATASDPQRVPSQAQLADQERISDDDLHWHWAGTPPPSIAPLKLWSRSMT
jgi:hypothetical protein